MNIIDSTAITDQRGEPARRCRYSTVPLVHCQRQATIRIPSPDNDPDRAIYLCDFHAGVFAVKVKIHE